MEFPVLPVPPSPFAAALMTFLTSVALFAPSNELRTKEEMFAFLYSPVPSVYTILFDKLAVSVKEVRASLLFCLSAILFKTVVENTESLPIAVASSLRVFKASGAPSTSSATFSSTTLPTNFVVAIFIDLSLISGVGAVGSPSK